jgi:prepilin-type N-terminal cleavage/methylation domain-containing protein
MKKRGFTLFEIVAVLGILSILFSIGVLGIKAFKERYRQIEIKSFVYSITDMLSYGKMYCVSENIAGSVCFMNDEDYLKVSLVTGMKVVRTIELLKVMKLKPFENGEEVKNLSLKINQSGYVEPKTISLVNENHEVYKITVQVGGNVLVVKEGEN